MIEINIAHEDIKSLKDKVVVLTGGSSGIGLATTKLLLSVGASVVSGDINSPPVEHERLSFVKTNVTEWSDLVALFDLAQERHGRIDHAFANAGVSGRMDYMEDRMDDNGKLVEPNHEVLDVNLKAVINTTYLALHHLRKQEHAGGSIVLTASASSYQRFRVADYTAAKHGVLGFMRGIVPNLTRLGLPIRINSLAPGWTETGMVPKGVVEAAGAATQSPDVVAKSAALLMASNSYQGTLIYSDRGKYWEIEETMLKHVADITGSGEGEDVVMDKIMKLAAEHGSGTGSLPGSSN
ncbi:hypothetical protein LTR97_009769 [Elasticomyces elasticus]|uniref:Uncharacterized protein n=1 Tax=Elasticomyces elasticus TaxID=574655 RepID=A0AAN7W1M9_9PEZI|nr:hypothetical protein LTR97_009769 [Elasticomyces elasticus]